MKLVTFDFWNTLFLDQDEGVRQEKRKLFALNILRKYHSAIEAEHFDRAFKVADSVFNRQWDDRKATTMTLHVNETLNALEAKLPADDLSDIIQYFETILLQHPPKAIPNALEAIHYAATRAKVGIISDTGYSPGTTLKQILVNHGVGECIHSFSFSNETGLLKPNAECFWTILRHLNVKPEEAVHVGDLENTDIAGAKAIGMKAIKYIGSNPTESRKSIADAVIDDMAEVPAILNGWGF